MCQGGSVLTILLYSVASFLSFFIFFFHFLIFPELSLQSVMQHTLLPCFAVFSFSLQFWQLLQDNIFAILIMLKEHVNEGQISVPKKQLYRRAKP